MVYLKSNWYISIIIFNAKTYQKVSQLWSRRSRWSRYNRINRWSLDEVDEVVEVDEG